MSLCAPNPIEYSERVRVTRKQRSAVEKTYTHKVIEFEAYQREKPCEREREREREREKFD
jgi:hypothetical protein